MADLSCIGAEILGTFVADPRLLLELYKTSEVLIVVAKTRCAFKVFACLSCSLAGIFGLLNNEHL